MKRSVAAARWFLPPLFCLALYWQGLWAWFQQDDFAWLGLRLQLHQPQDLGWILFSPMAQGTIRPWSERAYFLVFSALFDFNALPYRLLAFGTQFANLMLLSSITARLTGSRSAALLAPLLWLANDALAGPMLWSSSYNQLLCCFCILLAFYFLLRFLQGGGRGYLLAQWATFVFGFGAHELNAVYPAIATGYTVCFHRDRLRTTLPLWIPSFLYLLIHQLVAPVPAGGVYAPHFGANLLSSLALYWQWALGPSRLSLVRSTPSWFAPTATAALTAAILGFVAARLRRRDGLALFCLWWFLVTLLPVLPLRDHISNYYLTLPTLGLAILAAQALVHGWQWGWAGRVSGVLLLFVYLVSSVTVGGALVQWQFLRSLRVKEVVFGVVEAHRRHPGKIILLKGVDEELFWGAIFDKPFRLFGISEVYLAPGSEPLTEDRQRLSPYVYPPGLAVRSLQMKQAEVYEITTGGLRNVSGEYYGQARQRWKPRLPLRVDVGHPSYAQQLGPAWYEIEQGFRWMPKRATVTLGGPRCSEQSLYMRGYCPAARLAKGPVEIRISVEGHQLEPVQLNVPDAPFEFRFKLPAKLMGKEKLEVTVEVERTFRAAGDSRDLGAYFGVFEIR